MRLRSVLISIITLLGITVSVPQANAAIGDDWAFAYNNHLAPIAGFTPTDPARQWSKFGGPSAEVRSPGVGQYEVRFPKTSAKRGIVHVTAERQDAGWCQALGWKMDTDGLHVFVLCFKHGGALDNSRFTVLFTESSPAPTIPLIPAHAYVFASASGVIQATFNSAGFVNGVSHGGPGTGIYKVVLPMRGMVDPNGNFQVTAVGSKPARCKIAEWEPTTDGHVVIVACFEGFTNKPADSAWTLSYNRERPVIGESGPPKQFGYVWVTPGLPPLTNFNSFGAVNTVFFMAGQYLVTFPKVGLHEDHMQVTAIGKGSNYCGLGNVWFSHGGDAVLRNVHCFDEFGKLAKHDSFVAYTSRH